jgi:Glycosyltransferase family 87
MKSRLVLFFLAGMLSLYMLLAWNSRELVRKGYPDFTIFYSAGKIVRQGLGPLLYNAQTQYRIQQEFASEVRTRQGPLPYNHPPFEAALFVPFTYAPYPLAFALWDLTNLAMLIMLPFLLRPHLRQLQNYSWPLWVLASMVFAPIFVALIQGQDAVLLLFFYALAFDCLKKNHDSFAGGWIGLGLFKPHLVIPFIFLLLVQGRRKILYGFLPVATVLVLISAAIVGGEGIRRYPLYAVRLESTLAGGSIVPSDMPNLRGVMNMLFPDVPQIITVVFVISLGLLLFAAFECRKIGTSLFDLKFSLAAIATVLVSYHALIYDLSMLLIPVVLLVNDLPGGGRSGGSRRALTITAIAIFFFAPLQLILSLRDHRSALLGGVLLLWLAAVAQEISFRSSSSVDRNEAVGDM